MSIEVTLTRRQLTLVRVALLQRAGRLKTTTHPDMRLSLAETLDLLNHTFPPPHKGDMGNELLLETTESLSYVKG